MRRSQRVSIQVASLTLLENGTTGCHIVSDPSSPEFGNAYFGNKWTEHVNSYLFVVPATDVTMGVVHLQRWRVMRWGGVWGYHI